MGTKWLTDDDRERIREFVTKPAHERSVDDLVPDEDGPTDPT